MRGESRIPWGWQRTAVWTAHSAPIYKAEWSPQGDLLATAAADGSVRIWDSVGNSKQRLQAHMGVALGVAWSLDGRFLASSGKDRTICVWDSSDGSLLRRLDDHTNYVFGITWNVTGTVLASASDDATIKLWNTRTWSCQTLRASSSVWTVIRGADPGTFIAGCRNGEIIVCDTVNGIVQRGKSSSNLGIYALLLVDNMLIVGCENGHLSVRDSTSLAETTSTIEYATHISHLSVSPARRVVASRGLNNGVVRLHKIGEWDEISSLDGLSREQSAALSFHPSDFRLATTDVGAGDIVVFTLDEAIAKGSICRYRMKNDRLCGRASVIRGAGPHTCTCHSQATPVEARRGEIVRLLSGSDSTGEIADCTGFHVPPLQLQGVVVTSDVCFDKAHFEGKQDFTGAVFKKDVTCREASFEGQFMVDSATFHGDVVFDGTTFNRLTAVRTYFGGRTSFRGAKCENKADLSSAVFRQPVDLSSASFRDGLKISDARFSSAAEFIGIDCSQSHDLLPMLDCRNSRFESPDQVIFRSINWQQGCEGLRLGLVNCDIERVHFDDINWYRHAGRLVLHDELEIDKQVQGRSSHELVTIAYRRLMKSYDAARAYDEAEECYRGQLEMKARDPATDAFSRTTILLYGVASRFGASYARATAVLFVMVLVIWPVLFWLAEVSLDRAELLSPIGSLAPFVCSIETATFVLGGICDIQTPAGWLVQVLERVAVPAQLALLLLALQRRLRR